MIRHLLILLVAATQTALADATCDLPIATSETAVCASRTTFDRLNKGCKHNRSTSGVARLESHHWIVESKEDVKVKRLCPDWRIGLFNDGSLDFAEVIVGTEMPDKQVSEQFENPRLWLPLEDNEYRVDEAKPDTVYAVNVGTRKKLWDSKIALCGASTSTFSPHIERLTLGREGDLVVTTDAGSQFSIDRKSGESREAGRLCLLRTKDVPLRKSTAGEPFTYVVEGAEIVVNFGDLLEAAAESSELTHYLKHQKAVHAFKVSAKDQSVFDAEIYYRSSSGPTPSPEELDRRQVYRELTRSIDGLVSKGAAVVKVGPKMETFLSTISRAEVQWIGCSGKCRHTGHFFFSIKPRLLMLKATDSYAHGRL